MDETTKNIKSFGWSIASSTAEGGAGAADSAQVFYTGTAVSSKGFVVVGWASWESGLGTAGAWSAGPTRVAAFRPGGKLPGDIIASYQTTTNSITDTTSSSYSAAILTCNVTLTSAANLCRASGGGSVTGAATLNSGDVTLFRDSTVLAANNIRNTDAAAVLSFGVRLGPVIDKPNSAAALAYTIKNRGDGTHLCRFPTLSDTVGATLLVEELMA